jgi:hypothetical protein
MAKEQGKLIDPVSVGQKEAEAETQTEEMKALSIEALRLEDFQPIPVTASRQPHPFEGYPQKKIKVGTYKDKGKDVDLIVNAAYIVALNPKEYVHQDPSGLGVTIMVGGQEKTVDLKTHHNRIVRNERSQSVNVVFDRDILLAGNQKLTRAAICPDHTARSQLAFMVNKRTGKIEVDRRYVLADIDQVSRLRRCFEAFNYQQTQSDRLAQKFDEAEESKA